MPNLMRFDSLEKVTIDYSGGGNDLPVKVSLQNYPDRSRTFSIQNVVVKPGKVNLRITLTGPGHSPCRILW
jgi:hypothetical protein